MKVFKNMMVNSMKLPQKQAAFSLNRIGMDVVVLYLFFLLALASIPGLIDQINANAESSATYVKTFFLVIFFFIFFYLVLVIIVFGSLSVIAYIGTWIARATGRKLRYSILWKMAACITTIPLILFTILSFFYTLPGYFLFGAFLFHFIVFVRTILLYPKRRHKTR